MFHKKNKVYESLSVHLDGDVQRVHQTDGRDGSLLWAPTLATGNIKQIDRIKKLLIGPTNPYY